MATGKIEYNIEVPFIVTENNAVGPTADTALRPNSSLPNILSTGGADINTIYLDEAGGNDANSGFTFALAKKTWNAALAVISAARPTIHVQTSTGTDSQLSVTLGSTTALPADLLNIQVEAGQTARLMLNDFGYTAGGAAGEPKEFNGFEIVTNTANLDPVLAVTHLDSILRFKWSRFEAQLKVFDLDKGVSAFSTAFITADSIFVSRSLDTVDSIAKDQFLIHAPDTIAIAPVRSIFQHNTPKSSQSTAFRCRVFSPTNCLFTGFDRVVKANSASVVTFTDCIVQKSSTLATWVTSGSGSATGSLLNVDRLTLATDNVSTFDISDPDNRFNQDPLFLDETNRDFRLVHVGRTVNGVNYPINSPAVGIGASGTDAGPFITSYTPLSADLKTLLYEEGFGFDSVDVNLIRANYQEFSDIQSRYHNTWDDVQYEVKFKLTKKHFIGNSFSYEFGAMFRSKGVKRFFPYGDAGFFGAPVTFSVIDATNIDFTTNLPDLVFPDGSAVQEDLGINAFVGWIAVLTWFAPAPPGPPEAKTGFFEILSNTATALELEHIRGDSDITNGTDFFGNILYLPVHVSMKSLGMTSEYYSEGESTTTGNNDIRPFYRVGKVDPGGRQSAEFHMRNWTLRQTREDPS